MARKQRQKAKKVNNDKPANELNKQGQVSTELNPASTSSTEPNPASTASTEPNSASTASIEPNSASTASTEPIPASTASTEPNTASIEPNSASTASSEPNPASTASTEPNSASTASIEPNSASTASIEPNSASTASTEPIPASTASTEPNTASTEPNSASTASSEPNPASTASTEPNSASTASIELNSASTASTEPIPASTASTEPNTASIEPNPASTEPNSASTASTEPNPASAVSAEPNPASTASAEPNPASTASTELNPASTASTEPNPASAASSDSIILDLDLDLELLAKWPKLKLKIPSIFLHKPTDFEQHVKKLLCMGIKFNQPHLSRNYTKITCVSKNDHRRMIQYFEDLKLPYHTFGDPLKRKMKVVFRGLPKDTDLNKIKEVLKSISIPVIRVHKMYTKVERKDNTILVLVVVPYDDAGKCILLVNEILGHKVKLEPPITKPRQCHRCQKWGHSQRYCHGPVACVKCAGEHFTKKCDRISEEEPPKCANCGKDHTASYRDCIAAPGSIQYEILNDSKKEKEPCHKPIQLVTKENYKQLYKNVDYNKTTEPGSFPSGSENIF